MLASNETAHQWVDDDNISRVVDNFPNFEPLDLYVATALIEADNPRVVIANISVFQEDEHDEIVRALAEKGYAWEVKTAFDKFTGAKRSTLAEQLITRGFGPTLTSFSREDERRELGVTTVMAKEQVPGRTCIGYYIARDRDEEFYDKAPYKLIVGIGEEFFIGDTPVETLKQARGIIGNAPGVRQDPAIQVLLTDIFRANPVITLGR